MASNQTSIYGLNQWEEQDKVLREEFNQDNAKTDAALAGLAASVSGKASTGQLSSAESRLQGQIASVEGRLLKIATGSYVGTGGKGSASPCTLNFSASLGRAPQLLVVRPEDGDGYGMVLLQGVTDSLPSLSGTANTTMTNHVTWSGSRVSWYADSVIGQLNQSGVTYRFFALA